MSLFFLTRNVVMTRWRNTSLIDLKARSDHLLNLMQCRNWYVTHIFGNVYICTYVVYLCKQLYQIFTFFHTILLTSFYWLSNYLDYVINKIVCIFSSFFTRKNSWQYLKLEAMTQKLEHRPPKKLFKSGCLMKYWDTGFIRVHGLQKFIYG